MALHIIRSQSAFLHAQQAIDAGDSLLLIEAGVYLATQNVSFPCKSFTLQEDLIARALDKNSSTHVETTDYMGFVALSEQNQRIITW